MPCLETSFMGQETHWLLNGATNCSMTILPPSMEGRVLVRPQICATILFEVFVLRYEATLLTVYFETPIDSNPFEASSHPSTSFGKFLRLKHNAVKLSFSCGL
jgi:hypothetical protein